MDRSGVVLMKSKLKKITETDCFCCNFLKNPIFRAFYGTGIAQEIR
jgi:hypothetical protein